MADFDDLNLERAPAPPPPRPPRWIPIVAVAVLLFALAAVWYYLRGSSDLDRADATPDTALIPQATPAPVVETDVPSLDESDAYVRDLVRALSQHPIVAAWLTTDQLIRNFAVSVMNVADGKTPSGHLYTIKPDGTFRVRQQRTTAYIDPASYARYDGHAAAVDGIDPAGAARLYATLRPRIEEASREQAGSDANFDRALERAIVELLETPIVEGDVAVVPLIQGYGYADASLESLSGAQKQLLRMGPDNVRRVQQKLRAIARELGISESSLPGERVISAQR